MSTMHTEERIGEAWRMHRNGDLNSAREIFDDIISRKPESLDAYYGLGLVQRAAGETDAAVTSFQRAYALAKQGFSAVRLTSSVEGHTGGNDLDTYEDDRYMMLIRMIGQRLTELGVEPPEDGNEASEA